jgi:hypothetical protein
MADLPTTLTPALLDTRLALQQVAVHVLARRRHAVTGRFGLRPSPGGIATPTFDDEPTVIRTSGRHLVVERGAEAVTGAMATLRTAAKIADVELPDADADEFRVGEDTPAMVDPDRPLGLDVTALDLLARWYAFGAVVLDELVATEPAVTAATTRQLWPEHFDLGGAVTIARSDDGGASEVKANIGASPGDGFDSEPYLYLGPWDAERPGDPSYWNAPFGAVLRYRDLVAGSHAEPLSRAVDFLRRGVRLLAPG